MFISKTEQHNYNRFYEKKVEQNQGLRNVCYDASAGTIAENVRKKVEQVNNPLLASLTSKSLANRGFSSNVPRFEAKVVDEETYIGPGYYEQKSCFDKSRTN